MRDFTAMPELRLPPMVREHMSASMLSCLGARQLKNCLAFAGRNGPLCLVAGVTLGLLCPALAQTARPSLGVTVFVFTLGAFLKVSAASLRNEVAQPLRNASILLWLSLGIPLLVAGAIVIMRPDPGTAQGALLWALSPPSGAAAALAALLGLGARPARLPQRARACRFHTQTVLE